MKVASKKQTPASSSFAAMNSSKNKYNKKKRKAASVESEVTHATCPKKKSKTAHTVEEPPRAIDIVCGRGWGPQFRMASGNVAYRQLVDLSRWRYEEAERDDKVKINREIVELVKAQPGTPRFLEKNPTTRLWEELSYEKSIKKTSKTFRDLLGSKTKMSSKATRDDESEVDDDSGVDDDESRVNDHDESVVVIVPRPVKTAKISSSSIRTGTTLICSTISEPRSIDIVCGRTCVSKGHLGNLAFRQWLQACRPTYDSACSAGHYGDMVKIRIHALQQILEQPGAPRFLTFDECDNVWKELTFARALQEVTKTFKELKRNKQSTWKRPPAIPTSTAERLPVSHLSSIRVWVKDTVARFGTWCRSNRFLKGSKEALLE
jgi:hypothetical protein